MEVSGRPSPERAPGRDGGGAASPPPVFVVAGPFSHGALLTAMLGRNPSAYGLPEMNLDVAVSLDDVVQRLVGLRGVQLQGLLRVLAHLLSGEQTMASVELAWRWILVHSHWPTSWVDDFLRARIAPLCVVERVTSGLFEPERWARLAKRHPDARYVHIVRHPRSHGEAVMARGTAAAMLLGSYDEDVSPRVLDPQLLWLRAERACESFRATISPAAWHRVRAEDLLASTDQTLHALCVALDLPTDEAGLARMKRPEESPFAGYGPFGAHLGDDPDFMADPRLPGPEPVARLSGPLSWRPDGCGFRPEVVELARSYGYE